MIHRPQSMNYGESRMNRRLQKYKNEDPFPFIPFCEDAEGLPTLSEAIVVFLVVAFITVVFSF